MSERGNYRALHTVLVDDPDFQALSPDAKLLFYTGRLQLGPTGIGVLYDSALADQTGMGIDRIRDGMGELIAMGWIERQASLVWFVNGLKFDPSLSVNNENHVESIRKHLLGLPKLAIVNKFADHYGLETPFGNPSDRHWHTPPDGMGDQGRPITEKGNTEEGSCTGDSLPTVENTPGENAVVENSPEKENRWGDTVTACRKHLWIGDDPPDGRTIGQELSVAKQLTDRWNLDPPDVAEAVEGFARLRDRGFWEGWIERNEPAKMLALNRTPEDEHGIPVVVRSLHEMRKGEPATRGDSGMERLEVSA